MMKKQKSIIVGLSRMSGEEYSLGRGSLDQAAFSFIITIYVKMV